MAKIIGLRWKYQHPKSKILCRACFNWNHWHETPDGTCEDPRCECKYRPLAGEDRG